MRILTFNLEYGGQIKNISPDKYIDIIKTNHIDIAIFSEPFTAIIGKYGPDYDTLDNNLIVGKNIIEEINEVLNYNTYTTYFEYPITILSKYPIIRTDYDFVVSIQNIYIIGVHFRCDNFMFYSIRNIEYNNTPSINNLNREEIINLSYSNKKKNMDQIQEFINNHKDKKIIIAGDINEVSHNDDIINWRVSEQLCELGMTDTYRYLNNNKVFDTFNYNYDGYTYCQENEPLIRIDYIYTKNILLIESKVLNYPNLSDHLPLFTSINILSPTSEYYIRDVLQEVLKLSNNNNLKPWIDWGTLLGYVRHDKDIIPWDNDSDLCMMDDDYWKLYNIMKENNFRIGNLCCDPDGYMDKHVLWFYHKEWSYDNGLDVLCYYLDNEDNKVKTRMSERLKVNPSGKYEDYDYKYDDLYPLQETTMAGESAYIPNKHIDRIISSYGNNYMLYPETEYNEYQSNKN